MAVASLVLGIISIILSIFPIVGGWLGSALIALVGVVLGALAAKSGEKHGLAVAGLVCSIIGLALSLIFWIACAACAASLGLL